jgi:hypothetical protein
MVGAAEGHKRVILAVGVCTRSDVVAPITGVAVQVRMRIDSLAHVNDPPHRSPSPSQSASCPRTPCSASTPRTTSPNADHA